MSVYEQVIEEMVKHGVVIKINEIVDENYIPYEIKYAGCVVELDFSEHDKVFVDKIELLKRNLNLQKDKRCEAEIERNYFAERINQLKSENEELKQRIAELESENKQLKYDIDKMAESKSEWIDSAVEWQQKCEKLESKETSELPFDPLECANYLINATYERETSSLERTFAKTPDKVNSDRYTVDDLEQIAEHLLVYCKHNKESE